MAVGVEFAALAEPLAPVCFSAERPATDPVLAGRREELRAWLRAHPEVSEFMPSFQLGTPPWLAECACSDCEGDDATARARRLDATWSALDEAVAPEAATQWWGDAIPRTAAEAVAVNEAMDAALGLIRTDPTLPVRAAATIGPDSPWAPINRRLRQAEQRRFVVDLDLTGSYFGPTVAPLLFPDALHDRVRRHRALGVVGWLGRVDSEHTTALSGLRRAEPAVLEQLFRDFRTTPADALAGWVAARYGLGAEDEATADLVGVLRATGPALARASHPLGIPPRAVDAGLPVAFPIEWEDPGRFDPAWTVRREALLAPDQETLAAVHQAGAEAMGLVDSARDALERAGPALGVEDLAELTEALDSLQPAVHAWALVIDADATLRAWRNTADEEQAAWLRADADAMEALSVDVEASRIPPFPADAGRLRSLAASLRAELGPGTAAARPFPVLTGISHVVEGDRVLVRWAVSPSAGGSVQWGSDWPVYDDGGDRDDAPAVSWQAFRQPVSADTRLTYRVCAHLDGVDVCSSDRVLWTPR